MYSVQPATHLNITSQLLQDFLTRSARRVWVLQPGVYLCTLPRDVRFTDPRQKWTLWSFASMCPLLLSLPVNNGWFERKCRLTGRTLPRDTCINRQSHNLSANFTLSRAVTSVWQLILFGVIIHQVQLWHWDLLSCLKCRNSKFSLYRFKNTVTDLINALPCNSSVNTVPHNLKRKLRFL
jgi:hypothetical protein